MPYILEKKQPETFQRKKEKRLKLKKAKADSRRIGFDQSFKLRRQPENLLQKRADLKADGPRGLWDTLGGLLMGLIGLFI